MPQLVAVKRETFDLIPGSAWELLSPFNEALEVVLHVGKGVQKVNDGRDICSRATSGQKNVQCVQ